MVNIKVFHAKEGTIKIDAAGDVSLSSSTVIDTAFASATAITGQFKDVSIKSPVADVDKIDLMGTTSSFQNAEIEEKSAPLAEISGTLIVPGDEMMEAEIFGAGTTAGSTHTTYQPGLESRTLLAIMINADDGTDEVQWAGTNMFLTQWDPKFTGADGHLEAAFTAKCLPRDFLGPQFKN